MRGGMREDWKGRGERPCNHLVWFHLCVTSISCTSTKSNLKGLSSSELSIIAECSSLERVLENSFLRWCLSLGLNHVKCFRCSLQDQLPPHPSAPAPSLFWGGQRWGDTGLLWRPWALQQPLLGILSDGSFAFPGDNTEAWPPAPCSFGQDPQAGLSGKCFL